MKTAHLNVIKGLNLKYLFIKFDSKILQAPQIPIWETFVSKNLPDNCIKTFFLIETFKGSPDDRMVFNKEEASRLKNSEWFLN